MIASKLGVDVSMQTLESAVTMTTTTGPNLNACSMTETLAEASLYFMGQGALNDTLTQLAEDLKIRGIDYVVISKSMEYSSSPWRS